MEQRFKRAIEILKSLILNENLGKMKYSQDRKHYEDLCDRFTIDKCRRIEKKFSKDKSKISQNTKNFILYFIKGEEYLDKSKTVDKWMADDQAKDDKLENAEPLSSIYCTNCNSLMTFDFKDLHSRLDQEDRVLFFYKCPNCNKGRLFFDNGEEYTPKPSRSNSNYDDSEIDLKTEKNDPNFEADRKRFCLSEEEGKQYFSFKFGLQNLETSLEQEKENKKLRSKLARIKKMSVMELERFLSKTLAKNNYMKFEISKPELGKDVIVSFTVCDKTKKCQYDSRSQLKKLFIEALDNTNWHLMSDGIDYRLGILSGRLRGEEIETQ